MATLQYNATKNNSYGASASDIDRYFTYQTYSYSLSEGSLGNSHVVDITGCSMSNANTNGGSSSGYRMNIEIMLNGTWYTVGYISVDGQYATHQTFSNFISTADANIKSLMGKYPPAGVRGYVAAGYFHLNAGSQIVLTATTALDYTASTFTFSAASVDAGGGITVNISRMSADLTHTVAFTFGSATQTYYSVTTAQGHTIPLDWLYQIPNSTSGTCSCTVTTYYGGTWIGSNTGYFTITAGANIKPSLTSLLPAGVELYWGLYVQGKSKVQLTANGATGTYGSSIIGYSIWGSGYNGYTNPYTTGYLGTAGNNYFYATVTDSRGRTSDAVSCYVAITAYSAPSISTVDAQRCNDTSGTLADEGTLAKCSISYTWSAIGSNTRNTQVHYKETTNGTWIQGTLSLIASGGFAVIGTSGTFAIDKTYDIRFTLYDYFTSGSPTYAYDTLQTAKCIMDIMAGGTGIAFGQIATRPGVEISPDWPFYANGSRIAVPSNPNLLIGGNFLHSNPWQRGISFIPNGAVVYTADRWRFAYGTVAKSVTGLYIDFSSAWASIDHQIEHPERFSGKQMTLSIKLNGASSAIPCQCYVAANIGGVYSYPLYIMIPTGTAGTYSVTATMPTLTSADALIVCFACTTYIGAFDIEWIKLEYGGVATPEYPRSSGEELALCQRYFYKTTAMWEATAFSTANAWFTIQLPTRMRVVPSLLYSNDIQYYYPGVGYIYVASVAIIGYSSMDQVVIEVIANPSYPFTGNGSYLVYGTLPLDAEFH